MADVTLNQQMQWKAIMHPLRLAILKTLGSGEFTNQELANELGVAAGKLHFHTRKLLAAGLIELSGTRMNGPRTEKLYKRVLNENFRIPPVEDGSAPPLSRYIQNALSVYEQTWIDFPDQKFTSHGFHIVYYVSPESLKELTQDVIDLMHKIERMGVAEIVEDTKCVSLSALIHEVPEKH